MNMKNKRDEFEEDFFYEPGQESEDDVGIDTLKDISETVLWSSDWTVESILSSIKRGLFDLDPDFQRRDAWTLKQKSRFIESLIYGLPIPQIVLAESRENRSKFLVVDGKQRLTTLLKFLSPKDSFELTSLNNAQLNGLDSDDLENKFPDLFNNFLIQPIRSVVIKNWRNEELLYTIFYRLNSGSLPLSPQELRKALLPGKFMNFIDQYAAHNKSIKKVLNLDSPDPRMRDMDLLLRFLSFKFNIENYDGNYKKLLDKTCKYFNESWDTTYKDIEDSCEILEQSIELSEKIFGKEKLFKKSNLQRNDNRINRAIFDVITYYFSKLELSDVFIENKKEIVKSFDDLLKTNNKFNKSISSNTNNLKETSTRFVIWGQKLEEIIGFSLSIPSNLLKHYEENFKNE